MITEAYIAGAVEKAIFKKEDKYFILEKLDHNDYHSYPINHLDFNSFSLTKPEITHYNNIEWEPERLRNELNNETEKQNALDLFLIGMDKSLSDNLRREAMEFFLEHFSTNSEVETFVRNRIFATKVPPEFDAVSASQIADNIGNEILAKWYKDLSYANEIIIAVRDAWKKTLLNHVNQSDSNIEILDKEFTDSGILADFVLALLSQNYGDIDNAIVVHADRLKNLKIGPPAVFLSTLRQLVYDTLSITQDEVDQINLEDIKKEDDKYELEGNQNFLTKFNKLINNFKGKNQRIKKIKRSRFRLPGRKLLIDDNYIDEQITWIKEKIRERNLKSAERAILKLIKYQDFHSESKHL